MRKLFICLMATVLLTACDKETEDNSFITYLPYIQLKGDEIVKLSKGDTYTEEGVSATINNQDVSSQVKIAGSVDTSVPDLYIINYSLSNEDGYSASKDRYVYVSDLTNFEGGFLASVVRPDTKAQFNNTTLIVSDNGDDTRTISDILGGFYAQGRGYGDNYAMQAEVQLVPDGDKYKLVLIDSYIPGWGDSADDLEGTFDPNTGTISWTAFYVGYEFEVTIEL